MNNTRQGKSTSHSLCDTVSVIMVVGGLVMLTNCGRLGFDSAATVQPNDATNDAPPSPFGLATEVTGADLVVGATGIPSSMMTIVKLPNGASGVAWLGAPPSPLFGFLVDQNNRASVATANRISPSIGVMYGYDAASLAYVNGRIVGAVQVPDGTMYFKTFRQDLSRYETADFSGGKPARPAIVQLAGSNSVGYFSADTRELTSIPVNGLGRADFPGTPLGVQSLGVAVAWTGTDVAIASVNTLANDCTFFSASATEATRVLAACSGPSVTSLGDGTAIAAFNQGNKISVAALTTGPTVTAIADVGSQARAAHNATAYCVTWLENGIHSARFDGAQVSYKVIVGTP